MGIAGLHTCITDTDDGGDRRIVECRWNADPMYMRGARERDNEEKEALYDAQRGASIGRARAQMACSVLEALLGMDAWIVAGNNYGARRASEQWARCLIEGLLVAGELGDTAGPCATTTRGTTSTSATATTPGS